MDDDATGDEDEEAAARPLLVDDLLLLLLLLECLNCLLAAEAASRAALAMAAAAVAAVRSPLAAMLDASVGVDEPPPFIDDDGCGDASGVAVIGACGCDGGGGVGATTSLTWNLLSSTRWALRCLSWPR